MADEAAIAQIILLLQVRQMLLNKSTSVIFCAVLLALQGGSSLARPQPDEVSAPATDKMVAKIDRDLVAAANKGFGGAVIIKRGHEVLLSKGYGYADRKRKIRFTPDTVAQIGSITKSQTAAVVAMLVAEGKISLNDPVSRFIPEAPEPGRSRTIGQLLSHSSGLLDTCSDDFTPQSELMLIKTCLAKPLANTPGEDNYSNMGYSILALIIQRVTKKSWEDAVRERVWEPLGAHNIGFYFRGKSDHDFARGYLNGVEQQVISRPISKLQGSDWALRGNGGIQASARSMIQFLDGILNSTGGFLPPVRQLMLAPIPGQRGEVQEGFGFFFRYQPEGPLIRVGHSGSDGTFFSYLTWLPPNDVRLYFVGNNGEAEVKPLLQEVLSSAIRLPPASKSGSK